MIEDIRQLAPAFAVSPQVLPADLVWLKDRGIRMLVCNRPDGEARGQPTAAEMATAAAAVGLAFHYLPVLPGQLGRDDADALAALVAAADGPVLAYCRTGARSAALWAMT